MPNPSVIINGRLALEPEFRSLPTGSLLKLRVVTNDRVKDSSGEWVDKDTSYWNVEVWSKLADISKDILKKGMSVTIQGTQRVREYEVQEDGKSIKRIAVDIKANDIAVGMYSMDKISPKITVKDMPMDEDIWSITTPKQMVEAPF